MKKAISLLLCAALLPGLLFGCASQAPEEEAAGDSSMAFWQAENEILSYKPLDSEKTTLFVSRTGNTYIDNLIAAFEAENPDVQVASIDITGGNSGSSPVTDWVLNGCAPDIMLLPTGTLPAEVAKEYLTDLSASPLVNNFESEALNAVSQNSRLYCLPGTAQVDCMIYNKTLFEQYGWEVPVSFDEFVQLCVQIREDTNGEVQPWNPNAKYSSEFEKVTQAFVYQELFGGMENRAWYEEFCAGNATFAGHMEPYYEVLQTLIDNELLLEEHFSYSATTRGKEFEAGKIAMCNREITAIKSDEYEFDFMPFPTTAGDLGYICSWVSYVISVPLKEHSPEAQDAIDRFLAFFCSKEGQEAYISNSLVISSIKDAPVNNTGALMSLQPAITQGHMFTKLNFVGPAGRSKISSLGDAQAMLSGEKTAAECIAAIDAASFPTAEDAAADKPEVLATVAEPFSILETSNYIADLYREKTGADIGLITHGEAYRGNLMRMFPGDLNHYHINALLPRSLDNESTLVKVSMTGQQLLDALNNPVGNGNTSNSIYAFSGLNCEVAPWRPLGERYLSVSLTDGTAIDPEALYTVGIWDGTVAEEYITEVLESFEGTWEELMTEKMVAENPLAPAKDGRITLVWD